MNFKTTPYHAGQEEIENAVMQALETQFKRTALQLNQKSHELHKQTEIALGEYYRAISARGEAERPVKTHLSERFYKTILTQEA